MEVVVQEDDYETVYIVTAPFTGNEEEIAASFIIDNECGAEAEVENPLNENSCILTEAGGILVENVNIIPDKEYTPINVESEQLHSGLHKNENREGTEEFDVVQDPSDLQQEMEQELTENDGESLLLGNKRAENNCGYRYQRADIDLPDGVEVDEFTCPYCLKSFPQVKNKKAHMRSVHNVSFRSRGFIKCIQCDIEFLMVNKLRKHLREVHGLEMTEEIHKFPNMEGKSVKLQNSGTLHQSNLVGRRLFW